LKTRQNLQNIVSNAATNCGYRTNQESELIEEENKEWERQMMVFDEVFDERFNRLFGESSRAQ
jgi:hypothetical protein